MTKTPGPWAGTGRPQTAGPSAIRPTERRRAAASGRGSSVDGTGDGLALWCARHVRRVPMIRASVRPLRAIALVLAVAVVGGWLAAAPAGRRDPPPVVPARDAVAAVGLAAAAPPARLGASAAVPSRRARPATAGARELGDDRSRRAGRIRGPSARRLGRSDRSAAGRPRRARSTRPAVAASARPARRRWPAPPSTPGSSGSGEVRPARASRRRSCSPTARSGAAPPGWPTSPPSARSPPTPRSRSRASPRRSPRRSSSASPRTAGCELDASARTYLPTLADRSRDHGPPAARPHQRPARLLLRPGDRQGPAEQARSRLGPGPVAASTSASRTPSRARRGTTRTRTT